MSKKKLGNRFGIICLELVFILICFITLIPILYAISLSLSSGSSALGSGVSLLPKNITFKNYKAVLFDEPFLLWLKNSAILSVGNRAMRQGKCYGEVRMSILEVIHSSHIGQTPRQAHRNI